MIPREYEKYAKVVTVSVVNFQPVWGDKAANLDKMKRMVTVAAEGGSNIIAFPEMALSGYECGEEARREKKSCEMHLAAAETIPGPAIREIAKLTKKLGVYVLFGMPERGDGKPTAIYNVVAVVGPKGLVGRYRKIHLSPPPIWTDRYCFQSGDELPVFETEYGPIGVQICGDFWAYPELTRILWLKGARIVFNCSASSVRPGRDELLTKQTEVRAADSRIYTATANMVGKEKTISYCGGSTIAGPAFPRMSQVFARGGTEEEEIVTATLSFERQHYIWNIIDLRGTINIKLIAEEYRKLVKKE